jgi:chromosome partitioning protein
MSDAARAHVIVLGNEKGGSGKSSTAVHVVVSLLGDGFRVGAIDLDSRQRTLTRYLENREAYCARNGISLPMPSHAVIAPSGETMRETAEADERARLKAALAAFAPRHDFIVVDCPGSDNFLARLGHSYADTLLTPMNDSFVDLDLLAVIDPETYAVIRPSRYSEMVWEQRKRRLLRDRGHIDWVVMRNRLSHLDARNKQRIGAALESLAGRIGFRLAPGFGERVIYRELFLSGLTLLDLGAGGVGGELSLSHIAARNEVRQLMALLNLPAPAVAAAAAG